MRWAADNPQQVRQQARAWLTSPPLRALVAEFGGFESAELEPRRLIAWSAQVLDTRSGGERRDAPPIGWDAHKVKTVITAAGPLGLLESRRPQLAEYDLSVILGGATTGNRLRVALTRDLATSGVSLGLIAALGAERPLGEREIASEPESADDQTEWVNLRRHVAATFGPLQPDGSDVGGDGTQQWRADRYRTGTGDAVVLLVAPSTDPLRRANSEDAIAYLLAHTAPATRRRTLIVTSAIYLPYQFFAIAPTMLGAGVEHVELVGTPTSDEGNRALLAQRLAQEIHAGITTAARLVEP